MTTLEELPRRAQKYALTKVGLLHAALERLDGRPFEALQVRELCEAVGISEASFFNYFKKKSDLLIYFVQLWTVDVAWHAQHGTPTPKTVRESIARIFEVTAQQAAQHPNVMVEVLAAQARMSTKPELTEVTLGERLAAFPNRPGIEHVPARGLESLLPELLTRAVMAGELPPDTDVMGAFLGLSALFFGVPLILCRFDPNAVSPQYRAQLDIYWRGLQQTVSSPRNVGPQVSATEQDNSSAGTAPLRKKVKPKRAARRRT